MSSQAIGGRSKAGRAGRWFAPAPRSQLSERATAGADLLLLNCCVVREAIQRPADRYRILEPLMDHLVYLDGNATTAPLPDVTALQAACAERAWGNPSSAHAIGRLAQAELAEARARLAHACGCEAAEVVWTASGTEADVTAVLGLARARRRIGGATRVLASAVEHPAVTAALGVLAREGFTIEWVAVDGEGRPAVEAFSARIDAGCALVCVMLANNESGAILPVTEIATVARAAGIPVFCDAVNAFGKWPVEWRTLGVDALAISGHKFHGPRGVGALLLRCGTPFEPLLVGGGQERGLRSGTEHVAGAAALALAAELAQRALPATMRQMQQQCDRLWAGLRALDPQIVRHGPLDPAWRLPNTLCIALPGQEGSELQRALDRVGVAVSTGAACHDGNVVGSRVLTAMGIAPALARATLRISLCRTTRAEEIDLALARFASVLGRN
jgi:cysteine desulfurase